MLMSGESPSQTKERSQLKKQKIRRSLAFLTAFVLWTAAVCVIDVRPIGPNGSVVGLAALNGFAHRLIGVHMALYTLTDWLSLIPLAIVAGFGLLGLGQWIRRKSIRKVDPDILILGGFYAVVMAVFALFEVLVINYRPVLIDGVLEASYPSSTTMLVMCVMPTAVMQLRRPMNSRILCAAMTFFAVFMVAARLISGVHWLTDIVGGGLLSAALVTLYDALVTE